ncbi:MAG TPA: sigma factor [Acidothermaceae bacterium]
MLRHTTDGNKISTSDDVGRLYDMYGALCYRVALGILEEPEVASEVVREVFVAAWHARATFGEGRSAANSLLSLTYRRALEARTPV